MKISEILREDISTQESLKHINDILTVQLPGLYRQLKITAEKYANNYTPKRGDDGRFTYDPEKFIKTLNFVMGGQRAKWYQDVFFVSMKPALYNLAKSLPRNFRDELQTVLSNMVGSGKVDTLENSIIQLLSRIAAATKNDRLKAAVGTAKDAVNEYYKFIDKMEPIAAKANAPIDSGYDDIPDQPSRASVIGQQNASVDSIISDVLRSIDKKQAGEIRNIISKSDNKLMALQKELQKRGIKV